ncbi:TMhelix containing protein [Vibrio phage 1.293.O._10N.261.52.E1]|nr:TMhelix containing protein [Vibrio phage 1.293.O._10N.261.52.E1]
MKGYKVTIQKQDGVWTEKSWSFTVRNSSIKRITIMALIMLASGGILRGFNTIIF